jgi:hypothetical protein
MTRLHSTIIGHAFSFQNCDGGFIDLGYNICTDATIGFTDAHSRQVTDPLLGPLLIEGVITPTLSLRSGSPAIDAADPDSCPATDQRGLKRPQRAGCDIGAYEFSPPDFLLITAFDKLEASLRLKGVGPPGRLFRVQGTDDFQHWTELGDGMVDELGDFECVALEAGSAAFFRLVEH